MRQRKSLCPGNFKPIRTTVRYLTDQDQGGILQLVELDKKTGDPFLTMPRRNCPVERMPMKSGLENCNDPPPLPMLQLNITADAVQRVSRYMSVSVRHRASGWKSVISLAPVIQQHYLIPE